MFVQLIKPDPSEELGVRADVTVSCAHFQLKYHRRSPVISLNAIQSAFGALNCSVTLAFRFK